MGDTAPFGNPFWPGNFPDPFVLKVRGRYYAYATEGSERPSGGARVFPILFSPDLIQWEEVGAAMLALGAPFFRYWAPEVTEHNGRFLLYYAVHTGEFEAGIRVAVADRPEGPFEDSGRDLTACMFPWAIDPHVFRDADGCWYLYMTIEYWDDPKGLVGSGNAVARMADPFTLEPDPARVTPPRHAWELFEARRAAKGGVDWYCVEGPAVFRHRGRYYEMFSGGCYYRDNYAVSYATSPVPMGPDGMRDASWRDWRGGDGEGIIMCGDGERLISPGHNSLVPGPNNADLYMVYHVRSRDHAGRRPCLDRLYCHGDTLWTPAPTHGSQPAPAQPRLRALCGVAGDTSRWHSAAGRWAVGDDEAATEDASTGALLLHDEPLGPAWLLEVNLRQLDGDGRYGVALRGADATETRVMIDPALERLAVVAANGDDLLRAALPRGCAPGAWHQLLLAYAGEVLDVRLDGLPWARVRAPGPPERFALFSDRCRASFTAISLTDHFRDEFLDGRFTPAMLGWRDAATHAGGRAPGLHWRVHDGTLEQCDARHGEDAICKGAMLRDGEFGATLRLLASGDDAPPALGLAAIDRDQRPLRLWLERHDGRWLLVAKREWDVSAEGSARCELPSSFDPCVWHTLRVDQRGSGLTLTLDGGYALRITPPGTALIFGLATRHASAAFTGVWQTGYPGAGAHS